MRPSIFLLCSLMACSLVAAPPVKGVVLTVDALAGAGAPAVDAVALEREARAWLGRAGIALADAATADPGTTHGLKLVIRTSRGDEATRGCRVHGECALLWDLRKAHPEAGDLANLSQADRFLGQRGEEGFQENLRRMLRSTLASLLAVEPEAETPAASPILDYKFNLLKIKDRPSPPRYPLEAKMKAIQGTVVASVLVDPAGIPVRAEGVSGYPELMEEALRYALKWRFEPVLVDGVPRTVRIQLTMPFKLH